MSSGHALLSASSAHRWLVCTRSARLEEDLPDGGSVHAEEGTLAHRIGELLLRRRFEGADIMAELGEAETDPLYSAAMREHMEDYVTFIEERMAEAKSRCADPHIFIEQRLDFSEYVPGGFGTADCVIIADGLLDVIDLKYGTGVPVSAADNPQMKLYALGCLLAFGWAFRIDAVRMTVYQPRLSGANSDTAAAASLLAWAGGELRERANLAWDGTGEFCPGDAQCRWCKIKPTCRAHAEYQLALARHDFKLPALLGAEEIADIVLRKKSFENWLEQVKSYAEDQAVNHGQRFPGLKVVEGRSNRRYADETAIETALTSAGYSPDAIFKPKELLGITAMESAVGKKRLNELIGEYIIKPAGAPALVPDADSRPEISTAAKAADDFYEEET